MRDQLSWHRKLFCWSSVMNKKENYMLALWWRRPKHVEISMKHVSTAIPACNLMVLSMLHEVHGKYKLKFKQTERTKCSLWWNTQWYAAIKLTWQPVFNYHKWLTNTDKNLKYINVNGDQFSYRWLTLSLYYCSSREQCTGKRVHHVKLNATLLKCVLW
jgi:hypothetical protein